MGSPYNPLTNEGGAPLATTSLALTVPQERRRIIAKTCHRLMSQMLLAGSDSVERNRVCVSAL